MNLRAPCGECGTEIEIDSARRKYCKDCVQKVCTMRKREWKKRQRHAVQTVGKCKFCSKEFVHRINRTVFCGRNCSINSKKAAGYRRKINTYKKKITELRREKK